MLVTKNIEPKIKHEKEMNKEKSYLISYLQHLISYMNLLILLTLFFLFLEKNLNNVLLKDNLKPQGYTFPRKFGYGLER